MREVTTANFGILIAYLLPGFVALVGVGFLSETVASWLTASSATAPTVGGFLYVTLASLTAGLTVSTVRWAVIDTIHHYTGIREPRWDFSRLQQNVAAYQVLIEIHYRFYNFYANMVVALTFTYLSHRISVDLWSSGFGLFDVGFVLLVCMFFAGSRDTLRRYYSRVRSALGEEQQRDASAEQSGSETQKRLLNLRWREHTLKSDAPAVCRSMPVSNIKTRRPVSKQSAALSPH